MMSYEGYRRENVEVMRSEKVLESDVKYFDRETAGENVCAR